MAPDEFKNLGLEFQEEKQNQDVQPTEGTTTTAATTSSGNSRTNA